VLKISAIPISNMKNISKFIKRTLLTAQAIEVEIPQKAACGF
jgi:hypothetical protein